MGPKLQVTKDYAIFELHEFNRSIHRHERLLKSMTKHGWMPSKPMQVSSNGSGKLKVYDGHHRLSIAMQLKIPVWYVNDALGCEAPHELQQTVLPWSPFDHATAHAKSGREDYIFLLEFAKTHGLNLGTAASLVGGESAGSSNKIKDVKAGTFKKGKLDHANQVASVVDICRSKGISFATTSAFVAALSMVLRVKDVDRAALINRLNLHPVKLEKRGTCQEYLESIEAFYNYTAKNRLPLAFMAREASMNRQVTFGGRNKKA